MSKYRMSFIASISVVIFVFLAIVVICSCNMSLTYMSSYNMHISPVHLNTQMQLVKYFLNERNCIVTLFLVQGIVNRTGAVTLLGRVNEYKRPII